MPPPLWHPHHGILTYYLYEKSHNFFVNLNRCIPMRPVRRRGTGGARGGASFKKKRYSYENRSLPDLMMGVETSPLLFVMDDAAPKGAPRRPQLPDFLETVLSPPCPARGPETGRPHKNVINFYQFSWFGCELFVHVRFSRTGFFF